MSHQFLLLSCLAGGLSAASISEDFSTGGPLAAWQAVTPLNAANQVGEPRDGNKALVINTTIHLASQATVPATDSTSVSCTAKLASDGQVCLGLRSGQSYPPAYELRVSGDGRVVVRRLEAVGKESTLASYTAPAATTDPRSYAMTVSRKQSLVSIEVRQDAAVLGTVDDANPLDLGPTRRVHIRNWKDCAAGWIDDVRMQTP